MEFQGASDADVVIAGGPRLRGPAALLVDRQLARRLLLSLGALLATLLLTSTPASALEQRGHVFDPSLSFGAPGKVEGQFKHPSGIAVQSSTGDFYVADRGNNRVEEFEPTLNSEGKPTFVREFKVPYPLYVAVDNSTEASDPSKGDVYVVGTKAEDKNEPEPTEFIIYKFGPSGEPITKLTKIKLKGAQESEDFETELEAIKGIAVNSTSGTLFVYQEEEIFTFNNEPKNKGVNHLHTQAEGGSPGLAIDSNDDYYVGVGEVPESTGASELEAELTEQIDLEDERSGLFETGEEFGVIALLAWNNGNVAVPELDAEDTTAVAVNPANEPANEVSELNDVYIINRASIGGQDASTVAAFNSKHELIQRFSAPGLKDGDGIAVDAKTGTVYVTDGQADKVDIFVLEPQGPPKVEGLSACTLEGGPGCPAASGAWTLKAQIGPSGAATHYHFEYGPGSCSAIPSPCKVTPEEPAGAGLTGWADESATSEELPELATGVWHYRVVAKNEHGTVYSPEQTFTVLAASSGLPDHRQWELVSPAEKEGAEPEPITAVGGAIQASEDGNAISYVADGPMGAGAPEGSRSPEYTQILSSIGANEWGSRDLNTPNDGATGLHSGLPQEYRIFSSDLALALLEPFPGGEDQSPLAEPPLSPVLPGEARGSQEKTLYLRDDAPEALLTPTASEAENYRQARENGEAMKNPGYVALVTKANAPGGQAFGGGYGGHGYEGVALPGVATPDLSHVLFESFRAVPGIYESGPAGSCSGALCTGGDVQPISVLPNETLLPPVRARIGGAEGRDVRHAISNDGALVFWTAEETKTEPRALYVRDSATQETLQLDAVKGGSGAGPHHPAFQAASADGSRVFFTDTQRLTANSKAAEKLPDLYVAELSGGSAPGSPLSFTLTDLTPEGINGESADIQVSAQGQEDGGGGVLGASEDGSYVYFVANAALAPGAARADCSATGEERPAGTTCNLYVRHYEGGHWAETKLIAALSLEDNPDWGLQGKSGDLGYMTSRVSPNGEYLAFMSDRSLTGYDNEDVTSKAPGERLDEEVYLYGAADGRLVCASCNPTGQRPAGVYDAGYPSVALAVDRLEIWAVAGNKADDHWLAGSIPGWDPIDEGLNALYQSRYLSNSGRLFFNSPDHLVSAAESDKEKVYEYEPEGVGSCEDAGGCIGLISSGTSAEESAFLDASTSGDDVFFLTEAQLVQQDTDENFDVYDARVCEPSSRCLPPPAGGSPPCESEAQCKSAYTPASGFESPASTSTAGPGSVSAQHEVLGEKVVSPPPKKTLTQAQKLANALKACKKDKKKSRRVACEKQARKSYGPRKPAKGKKASAKRGGR